jgi:DNA-binding response OmpR family regulator
MDAGADDYVVKPFAARELGGARPHPRRARRVAPCLAAEMERANRELEAFSYSVPQT